jgi:acyl-CoA synthetase (AMP-forming)/AMP-acid ligase II
VEFGLNEDQLLYPLAEHLIIRGGQNISPLEIEQIIAPHDAVSEVAVVGVPDPERLELFNELPKTAGGELSRVTVRSAVAERSAAR